MAHTKALPPGQRAIAEFPRFGLWQFAHRFPRGPMTPLLEIGGDVAERVALTDELDALPRTEQVCDFHCVTTWSRTGLRWSGIRFRDFYERIVVPRARPAAGIELIVFRCRDGYAVGLPLADLLADDVLLADRLNGAPLPLAHGAPLRLVAPAHYGYKNPKHLRGIDCWRVMSRYPSTAFPFRLMDHPRARVALEERAHGLPGWLLRYLYRPLIAPTIREFRAALARRAAEPAD